MDTVSKRDLERLRSEINGLTVDEQRELVAYLVAGPPPNEPAQNDINAFRGILKLSVDPVEYQRMARADRN